ncbi:MAG: BamA/TamA family outer membrane protein [Deltaproteobacteria bacterium]|nr:BamA/TamA family outer membrane protein [Deltaproteobacteria bacterium]
MAVTILRATLGLTGPILGLLLALLVGPHKAQADPPSRVASIEVSGAERTTRDTVLTLARIREGDPWREGQEAEVLQNLRNARLFYDESVEAVQQGDAVALRIRVTDKWSLIPVPLVLVRSGERVYGLTVLESNVLGRGKKLIAVAKSHDGEPAGSLIYIDPYLLGTQLRLFAYATRDDTREDVWDEDEKIGSYRLRQTGGVAALGYRLTPRTSLSAGLRLMSYRTRGAEGLAEPPADARERALSLRLEHDGVDFDEELRRGSSLRVVAEQGVSVLGDQVDRWAVDALARYSLNPAARHTLALDLRGLLTDDSDYVNDSTDFLRGYEAGRFRPDRLLGGSLEYRVPIAKLSEATVSVVGFADAALLRDPHHDFALRDLQADAGAGVAIYLRRVALPVLQLHAAYGFANRRLLPGFSLGAGF